MTNFEKIKSMSVDELANYITSHRFPDTPCYICPYDEGMHCISPVPCSREYKTSLYKKWFEEESKL